MRAVPDVGVALIKKMEIYVGRVYDDAHPNKILEPGDTIDGTLTAAWGHTSPHLVIGQTVTPEIGTAWLLSDLGDAVGRLRSHDKRDRGRRFHGFGNGHVRGHFGAQVLLDVCGAGPLRPPERGTPLGCLSPHHGQAARVPARLV